MTEEHVSETPEVSTPESEDPRPWSDKYIYMAIGGFIVTCVVLFFGASWITPDTEPGYKVNNAATFEEGSSGVWQITIDVSDRHEWAGINFSQGKRLDEESSADLLGRRYLIRAPGGAVNLGNVSLEDAKVESDAEWKIDKDNNGEIMNPAIGKWYSYSYWTHLLDPHLFTYAVRLADGSGVAYIRIVSYYCVPEGTGCLTLRYRIESWPNAPTASK